MPLKHFEYHELLPPEHKHLGNWGTLKIMDKNILTVADYFRHMFGSTVINNYNWGGSYMDSGFRNTESYERMNSDFDKSLSQHKYGRAIDVKPNDIDALEAWWFIVDHPVKWLRKGLKRIEAMELTVDGAQYPWIHLDCGYSNKDGLVIVTLENEYTIDEYERLKN